MNINGTSRKESIEVLLISDNAADVAMIDALVDGMEGQPFDLTCVSSYQDGIEEVVAHRCAVGLVNLLLGERSGLDLIEEASGINADMPMILLTEGEHHALDARMIDVGVTEYLPIRDLNRELLRHSLRQALNRKRAERKLRNSNDELVRNMLDLRDAKERTERQSAGLIRMAEDLAAARDEIHDAFREAEESERRYRVLAEHSPVGIWHLSMDGHALYLNSAMRDLLEVEDMAELQGVTCDRCVVEDCRDAMNRAQQSWVRGETADLEVRAEGRRSGVFRDLVLSGAPLRSADDVIESILVTALDITERKEVEETIRHMARHDALTGLPNRLLFQDHMDKALAHARRSGRQLAILFLDLDHFKDVNDTLGHPVGDLLLQQVAARLLDCMRDTDTVARFGGDEFAVICADLQRVDDVTMLARRIIDSIATPFDLDGQRVHTGTSLGATIFPDDTDDAEQLLKYADLALYHAKDEGRGTYHYYDENLESAVRNRKDLENDLRHAITHQVFTLHYQPQVNLATGDAIGAEALIRWRHDERGMVSPGEFIPLAESTGLIIPIGEWVLRTACEQIRRWHEDGIRDLRVAINLSAVQLKRAELVDVVRHVLADTGIDPGSLELELTESMVMDDIDRAVETMRALSHLGVALSIDDFGTGFSSLSYLKKFPVGKLKIDQSFVRNIIDDPDDAAIATTIIKLAHSLNMSVMAEGTETREQTDFLLSENCDAAQGYYFGRPMPADDFVQWLREYRAG